MAFSYTKLACVLLIISMAVAPPAAEAAISCGTVSSSLAQCLPYLQGTSATPSSGCCSGIKSLNSQAKSTADRQAACNCIKSTASSVSGLVPDHATSLPSKCNVNIGYPISMNVDCSKVH